jgi:TusA-related sulfurtransferase
LTDLPRNPDRRLDTVGYYCPIPVIRTGRVVDEMKPGETLEIVSDDRGALADIPDWCASRGHDYLGRRDEDGEYHLYIRKR